MAEVKVAVLGGSGWMGKVHTMPYQTFPHFLGVSGGTERRPRGPKRIQGDRPRSRKPDLQGIPAASELRARLQRDQDHRGRRGREVHHHEHADVADVENGHHICQIVDACMESSRRKRWVDIPLS
jgi:predicted dehydrogenase